MTRASILKKRQRSFSIIFQLITAIIITLLISQNCYSRDVVNNKSDGRDDLATKSSVPCVGYHNIGRIQMTVHSTGIIAKGNYMSHSGEAVLDCLTGEHVGAGLEFPNDSELDFVSRMEYWFGAVIGRDSLVSSSFNTDHWWSEPEPELFQDPSFGGVQYRSTIDQDPTYHSGAVSEQDYIAVFNDSERRLTYDRIRQTEHKPLNIQVVQKSYAWSYPYAEDFILINMNISNQGDKVLNDFYFGIAPKPSVSLYVKNPRDYDDIVGFLPDYESFQGCGYRDTVNIAWFADNDGDPFQGEFIDEINWFCDGGIIVRGPIVMPKCDPYKSTPHVGGIKFIDSKLTKDDLSFNWWKDWYYPASSFAPVKNDAKVPYAINPYLTTSVGDQNKFYLMSNKEIDYDVTDIALIRESFTDWTLPTNEQIASIGVGSMGSYGWRQGEFVFSRGPFTISPGASIDIVFAVIVGENLHTDPNNHRHLPNSPHKFKENLDFSDLTKNAMWANWVYDNPGVDTDGDGYFGKYRICIKDSVATDSGWVAAAADTFFYEGDGIPDWRAAGPPPSPTFWIEPLVNGIRVRFNGSLSETEKDYMTGKADFEGYHVWLGRDDRESSLSLVGNYDRLNFDKLTLNRKLNPLPDYELLDDPYTLQELRCLYGEGSDPCFDSSFNPILYNRNNPFYQSGTDSVFIFAPHNFNSSELGVTSPIRKVYPDEPPPPDYIHPDSLSDEWYTEEGFLKYYEYELIIERLLPTVPYWINVTVFDHGSPKSGLFPLETPKRVGMQELYPYISGIQSDTTELKAYVYPNPYRIDDNYRQAGYEGRTNYDLPNDKVRKIHFANLPAKCTISIFSIDGDLVREIHHDFDGTDPNRFHDTWNLINRNRQIIVSGLYYWTVEDDNGKVQMGKLVVIM